MQRYYDFEEIKEIPLQSICEEYGIDLKEKGNVLIGKIRNEADASFRINKQKNLWHDYGIAGSGGGSLQLVMYLENCDYLKAAEILGQKFNLRSLNDTWDNKWHPLTDNQYLKIGIQADQVTKNIDFDLENYTMEQALKLKQQFENISIQELAIKKPQTYHAILQRKAIPFIYDEKNSYNALVINTAKHILANGKDNTEYKIYKEMLDKASEEYKEKYGLLKKAIKDKSIIVGRYNIGNSIDDDLQKALDNKLQFECGSLFLKELKEKVAWENATTTSSKDDLRYFEVSDEELKKLFDNNIEYACFTSVNRNNVVMRNRDFTFALAAIDRKTDIVSANDNTTIIAQATKAEKPTAELSDFGLWAKKKMLDDKIKVKDLAEKIGVDSRRISEALRGQNETVGKQIKIALGYEPTQIQSCKIQTNEKSYNYFSELTMEQKKTIINIWYENKKQKNNRIQTAGGKAAPLKSKEEYRTLFEKNRNFKYDNDLKAHKIDVCCEKIGTVDYKKLKTNNPFYITLQKDEAQLLINQLQKDNFPFSCRINKVDACVTIPTDKVDDFQNMRERLAENLQQVKKAQGMVV